MFHLFYIKKNVFILLNMPGSKPESEQDCERKLHSPLSKLKTTLEMSKVYSKKRVDLKICASPEKAKKNRAKSPGEGLIN